MSISIFYKDLIFEIPYKIKTVDYFEITKKINEHATLVLKSLLYPEATEQVAITANEGDTISIKCKTDFVDKTLFVGIPTEVEVKHINGIYHIKLTAKSYSYKTDIKIKSRSFQNKQSPYKKIYETVIKDGYSGDFLAHSGGDINQNRTIIQYRETDWEFLKRIASHNQGVILPESTHKGVKIHIGVPNLESYTEEQFQYSIRKKINLFEKHHENFDISNEFNYVAYQVESPMVYDIGDNVTYKQNKFAISEVIIKLEKGLLNNLYKLQLRDSLKQMEIRNQKINGVSIDGKIIAVSSDKLKLHLEIDESQSISEAHFYQYNTPYTTEGTTGWYVMPQVGDSGKLYIPNNNEDNAYVRVINRTDGDSNPKTSDPTTKYLGSIDGKELKMSPTEVKWTAKEDETYMTMSVESGINATSKPPIKIISGGDISYYSGKKMTIDAKEEIKMQTSISGILMDNKTHMRSMKIREEGSVK